MATPKKLKTPTFSKVWHYYEGLWETLDTTIRGREFRFVAPLLRINPDMPEMSRTMQASEDVECVLEPDPQIAVGFRAIFAIFVVGWGGVGCFGWGGQ